MSADIHWPPGWGPDCADSFVDHQRVLAAPIQFVFACLLDVERWPVWQLDVQDVQLVDAVAVGCRFVVSTHRHTLDGIVGELVAPHRFGWAAVSDELSFYQSWLLLDEPGGGTRVVLQESARGPAALLRRTDRSIVTRRHLDAL
ncbi:SRPBCC family protein [Kribbella sp. NPDC051770]|uniref:SRPBCC family protein n=1 Tax=Kribbella sp. NPDC051770 TaxID=3155413 RepID=UPI00341A38FD